MALSGPGGMPINPEQADNYEEIEKQFAVKGVLCPDELRTECR